VKLTQFEARNDLDESRQLLETSTVKVGVSHHAEQGNGGGLAGCFLLLLLGRAGQQVEDAAQTTVGAQGHRFVVVIGEFIVVVLIVPQVDECVSIGQRGELGTEAPLLQRLYFVPSEGTG